MFSRAYSGVVVGIDGVVITVEADVSDGLPMYSMVGYLSAEVKEARERVRIALKHVGVLMPPKRITINLSPADIRKEGTQFDLAIAVSVLSAFGMIPKEYLEETVLVGELSLNGEVMGVSGILPIIYAAKKQGMKQVLVPAKNAKEAAVVPDIDVIAVHTIKEVVAYLTRKQYIEPMYLDWSRLFHEKISSNEYDFNEVIGQMAAKRAIEIAVSGQHNMLLIGPPGVGKTMLATRIPTIMPDLSFEESIQISKIYSISGLLDEEEMLIRNRPFRSPHHTISEAALVGGGKRVRPGEISLASGGVLFLDELPEFKKTTLELLRQPLEEGKITISRTSGSYQYPTNFMLVAAMNPCNCGFFPDRSKCHCNREQIKRYMSKISKPLLDRIDVVIETTQVESTMLREGSKEESSIEIKERVQRARKIQYKRYEREKIFFNAELTPKLLKKYCVLGEQERMVMEIAYDGLSLSTRAYHRILKVARTIADLAGEEEIREEHLKEAICYRCLDQKYWEE